MYLASSILDCNTKVAPPTIGQDRLATLQAVLAQPLPKGSLARQVLTAVAQAPTNDRGACAWSVERIAAAVTTKVERVYATLRSLHVSGHIIIRRRKGRIAEIRIPTLPGEPVEFYSRIVHRRRALCTEFASSVNATIGRTASGRDLRLTGDLVIQWAALLRAERRMTRAELAADLGLSERQCRALVPAETITDKRGKHTGLRVKKDGLFRRGRYPAKSGKNPFISPPLFAAPTRARAFIDSLSGSPGRTFGAGEHERN